MSLEEIKSIFEAKCQLNVDEIKEAHGDIIIIPDKQNLTCDNLSKISNYIIKSFYISNIYQHKLVKLQIVYDSWGNQKLGLRMPKSIFK